VTGLTRRLARFIVETGYGDLPPDVRREGPRTVLNWLGCVYGGLRDPTSETGFRAMIGHAGQGGAMVIGRGRAADPVAATFFNTLASSAHGYDDAHLATVAHPGGPAAAAGLAAGQTTNATGFAMLGAILLGVEIQCRMSRALVAGPDRVKLGFYMTGLTGALGAAATAGKLLGLDERRMCWALGIAAANAAGFRETHASMANALVRAQAARNGVMAALLAQGGFTCSENALEGGKGFMAVFGSTSQCEIAAEGLGAVYELLQNTYKPYPCGMPINPTVDCCLEIAAQVAYDEVESVALAVHPLALQLTGRRDPADVEEARYSLYHWAAAAFVRRRAGLAEIELDCVTDPVVMEFSRRISAAADPARRPEGAGAVARLKDGRDIAADVDYARGSIGRPMSDAELEQKFADQAARVLPYSAIGDMIAECRTLASDARFNERRLFALL
jgi:2-methylcitrate dehydratase PrpD